MPNYHTVHMSHPFLTGFHVLCNPYLTGPVWDCVPYDLNMIKNVNEDKEGQAKKDVNRTEWHFGKRLEDKRTGGSKAERRAVFNNFHEFRLYSWLVPERQSKAIPDSALNLEEVLKDRRSLQKLLKRAQELQKLLKKAGLSKGDAEIEKLNQYVRTMGSSREEKMEMSDLHLLLEETIQWMEEARRKLKENNIKFNQKEDELDLTLNECEALFAFSISIGQGTVVQGGYVRGVTESCFRQGWIIDAQKFYPYSCLDESQRLRRLPDGRISVSSCYELDNIAQLESPEDKLANNPKRQALIKISSDHIVEQKTDEMGRPIFTITPQQQELKIENGLWNTLINQAIERLHDLDAESEVFRPKDLFTLIPYLEDERVKTAFFNVIVKQPDFVIDFAMTWIMKCYLDSEVGVRIVNELNQVLEKQREAFAMRSEAEKPRMIKSKHSADEYRGYLNDSHSQEGFTLAFAQELSKLEPEFQNEVLSRIETIKRYFGEHYDTFYATITARVSPSVPLSEEALHSASNPNRMWSREVERKPNTERRSAPNALSVESGSASNHEQKVDWEREEPTRKCSICGNKKK